MSVAALIRTTPFQTHRSVDNRRNRGTRQAVADPAGRPRRRSWSPCCRRSEASGQPSPRIPQRSEFSRKPPILRMTDTRLCPRHGMNWPCKIRKHFPEFRLIPRKYPTIHRSVSWWWFQVLLFFFISQNIISHLCSLQKLNSSKTLYAKGSMRTDRNRINLIDHIDFPLLSMLTSFLLIWIAYFHILIRQS